MSMVMLSVLVLVLVGLGIARESVISILHHTRDRHCVACRFVKTNTRGDHSSSCLYR